MEISRHSRFQSRTVPNTANSIGLIRDVPTSVITTVNEKVISNGFDIDFEDIMPCNQEVDKRLIQIL